MARQLKQGFSLERGIQESLIDEDQGEKMLIEWRKWGGQTGVQIICKRS